MARRGKTVLIVDDEVDFQVLIQHIFKGLYDVRGARTVEDALKVLQRAPVDIVLLDIKLPGRLGWDLLQVLGNKRSSPPVVVITAQALPEVRRRAAQMGAIETFFKPILPSEIRRYVRRVLG